MRTFIILLLSCASTLGGETLVHLKSGETNMVSYALDCVVSDSRSGTNASPGADLVLTVRNNGAKWIGTQDVSVEDFSLRDAKGHDVKIWRGSATSSGIGYGNICIIHLLVAEPKALQPWTLQFKSKPKNMVSIDLTITDIEPRKKQ
ncbi:MAG: hypothetical protein JWO95_918 [Verrucomicrobiales bacterium]|nr:hypothetical protein [Verrucomicrobiales bacterium]